MPCVAADNSIPSHRQRNDMENVIELQEKQQIQKEPEMCYVLPLGSWTFPQNKKYA